METKAAVAIRGVDLDTGGPGGPYGGLYVYCAEAGVGIGFSDPEDQDEVIARVLDLAEGRLGEPLVVAAVRHRRAEGKEDGERDLFGEPIVPKPPKKRARRTRAQGTAEQERWY